MWEHYIAHELHKFRFEVENLPTDEFDSWLKYFQQKSELERKQAKKAQQKAGRKPRKGR